MEECVGEWREGEDGAARLNNDGFHETAVPRQWGIVERNRWLRNAKSGKIVPSCAEWVGQKSQPAGSFRAANGCDSTVAANTAGGP